MKATLKSADGKHEYPTVVSEPPPITLIKRKELWSGGLKYGLDDLPIYIHDGDVIHFKLASVIKYPKLAWQQPDEAIYHEVGKHEAELARAQVAKDAEQHRLLREYERKQAERVLKLQVEAQVAAQHAAQEQRLLAGDRAWLYGPQQTAKPPNPWWNEVKPLTTLTDRDAASEATLRSMQESDIPAPEETKKRMMKR